MARNRMIKPEFWSSETLSRLSLESNLLFIGMWNYADDSGVMLNNNRKLLGDIFPLRDNITDKNIEKWKSELIEAELIIPVEVNNKKLLIIRSWFEHQKVANPSKRYHIEGANKDTIYSLISSSLESNESLITSKVSKEERRKKKEERIKKKDKIKYAEFVELEENEHKKLIDKHGKKITDECIKILSNYKGSNGKDYKSDYHAILSWVLEKVKEKQNISKVKEYSSGIDNYEVM